MNSGSDIRFPEEMTPQLVLDCENVLPALEISTRQQRADVDEGRLLDLIRDGAVESQSLTLEHVGTRAQLGQTVDASDVAEIEPSIDPAVGVTTQHNRTGTCQQP